MLEGCNLKAHPNKTVIGAATVKFLGHYVSAHGLLPNEAGILAMWGVPDPLVRANSEAYQVVKLF